MPVDNYWFERAMKQAIEKKNTATSMQVKKAEPVKATPPSLTTEEIQKYVAIIAAAAEGFHPNESTTDRLIRERLEAQGLAPNKKQ